MDAPIVVASLPSDSAKTNALIDVISGIKPKKAVVKKDPKPVVVGLENMGKRWDDKELMNLLILIRKSTDIAEIAKQHKRTNGAIVCKLKEMAVKYVSDGFSLEQVQKFTGLTIADITDALARDEFMKQKSTIVVSS